MAMPVVKVVIMGVVVIVRRMVHGSPYWCERGESNPHELPHWILNPARLPVPPLSQDIIII